MDDYTDFKSRMSLLGEIHNKEISDVLKDAYWIALKQYPDDACRHAFDMAVATCKFFPKPAELIEIIVGRGGSVEDVAQIEAGKVLDAIKRIGGYQSVCFDDAITQAVIVQGFGGWEKMCSELKSDGEMWFRKDFVKIYGSYSRMGFKITGHLAGRSEISCCSKGIEYGEDIRIIGDIDKANKVLNYTENIRIENSQNGLLQKQISCIGERI